MNTRQPTEQRSCSKTTEAETTTCSYRKKEPPRPKNVENSSDWLKRKEQPRNQRGQFTSPEKSAGKPMQLDLSMVSDDEFQCCNTSEGKPIHTGIDDELQLPKETNLTPETGIKTKETTNEQNQSVRKSKRISHAKQTKKLGGIPYQTKNNKKKTSKNCILQETRPPFRTKHRQTVTKTRTTVEYGQLQRIYKTTVLYGPSNPNNHTSPTSSGGEEMWNAEIKLPYYITVTLIRELFRSLFTNKL